MSEHESMTENALDALLRQEGALWLEAREGCPHPDLLVARGSELVDEDTRRRLDAHVAGCDACARLSAGLADLRLAEPDAAMEQRVLSRVTSTGMPGVAMVADGGRRGAGRWRRRVVVEDGRAGAGDSSGVDDDVGRGRAADCRRDRRPDCALGASTWLRCGCRSRRSTPRAASKADPRCLPV